MSFRKKFDINHSRGEALLASTVAPFTVAFFGAILALATNDAR